MAGSIDARHEVPEQAVVADDELRAGLGGALEQLALSGHARHHERDLVGARHLQPLGP